MRNYGVSKHNFVWITSHLYKLPFFSNVIVYVCWYPLFISTSRRSLLNEGLLKRVLTIIVVFCNTCSLHLFNIFIEQYIIWTLETAPTIYMKAESFGGDKSIWLGFFNRKKYRPKCVHPGKTCVLFRGNFSGV